MTNAIRSTKHEAVLATRATGAALLLGCACAALTSACTAPVQGVSSRTVEPGTGAVHATLDAGSSQASSGESQPDSPDSGASQGSVDAGASTSTTDAGTGSVDESAILGMVAYGAFRASTAFVHVSSGPYPSAVATGSTIDEWVSYGAATDYEAITPDGGATSAALPVGAMIVREVIDGTGAVTEMTLLVKGPAGYNPAIGDWWWGVTNADGSPALDDGGVLLGRLTQCYSCHVPHSGQDFLFGVPTADR